MHLKTGLGIYLLTIASSLSAATAPATVPASQPAAKTMELHYKDVSIDTILDETSEKLGFIPLRTVRLPQHITLESDQPVDAKQAIDLLNEKLLPLELAIRVTQTTPPNSRTIARVGTLAEWKKADEEAKLPPLPPLTYRPGISLTETMDFNFKDREIGSILQEMQQKFGYEIVDAAIIKGTLTVKTKEPLHALQAVQLLNDLLFPVGYKAVEKLVPDPAKLPWTELQIMTFDDAHAAELAARRALVKP